MSETVSRNSATQKQAKTWLTPEQIERIRDACLSESFAPYLQDRNETLIVLLADTGLRVSELVALDWEYLDLDAEPGELYLPSERTAEARERLVSNTSNVHERETHTQERSSLG